MQQSDLDRLWKFVRHTRSQKKYCGLAARKWSGPADCQPLDSFATTGDNHDSSFEGDTEIGIGLVYAALQWPEYTDAATDWLVRMECEINANHGDGLNYPSNGDAWDKTCPGAGPCVYAPGAVSHVLTASYSPAYFRVFGDLLSKTLGPSATASTGQTHRDFWYSTAEAVYELVERCHDEERIHPALLGKGGDILHPCQDVGAGDPLDWSRGLWRLGIDAAWFGDRSSLPENTAGSSKHYPDKSRVQAKIDHAQAFFADFHKKNPPEPDANRFSSLCDQLTSAGTVTDCDPTLGHNATTVNLALAPLVSAFDNNGATTASLRREALEESVTATVLDEHAVEEALGVYSLLFLTGNFPNPLVVSTK